MLDVLIEGMLGGLIDGTTSRRRARKKAERRQHDFAAGADVIMPCSLRRPPGSGAWTHGTLRRGIVKTCGSAETATHRLAVVSDLPS